MSKFLSAFARSVLQIGGAALGVSVGTNNPFGPEAVAAYAVAAVGFAWSQWRATKTSRLVKAVDAAPDLPPAKVVEGMPQDAYDKR